MLHHPEFTKENLRKENLHKFPFSEVNPEDLLQKTPDSKDEQTYYYFAGLFGTLPDFPEKFLQDKYLLTKDEKGYTPYHALTFCPKDLPRFPKHLLTPRILTAETKGKDSPLKRILEQKAFEALPDKLLLTFENEIRRKYNHFQTKKI